MKMHIWRFGFYTQRMLGADDKPYLCAVIWYPNGRRSLGYFYPSIRWF